VSLKRTATYDFGPSAAAAAKVAAAVLEHGLPPRSFININVPAGTPKGMRVTTQAKRNHVTKIDARTDPRGNAYYWIEEALDEYHPDSGRSDHEAVRAGYVSVTPLQPDMTAYEVLEQLDARLK
jgi:5'/3'-nucleotidase